VLRIQDPKNLDSKAMKQGGAGLWSTFLRRVDSNSRLPQLSRFWRSKVPVQVETQFITQKAFANFSPGKGFGNGRTLSGLIRKFNLGAPGLSLRSNPGLKLANAFGVFQTEPVLA
jgi:hypothetical protein